jgi:hypothetical protein
MSSFLTLVLKKGHIKSPVKVNNSNNIWHKYCNYFSELIKIK